MGLLGRLYYGFLATSATLIFAMVAVILLRASSELSGPYLLLFWAGAAATPVAAWYMGRASITGIDLYKIAQPRNQLPALIWTAALGDSNAVTCLHSCRERLRAEIARGSPIDELQCRAAYSVILEQIAQTLKAVSPDNVEPVNGSFEDKRLFIARLETELAVWRADYAWFEKIVDSAAP